MFILELSCVFYITLLRYSLHFFVIYFFLTSANYLIMVFFKDNY